MGVRQIMKLIGEDSEDFAKVYKPSLEQIERMKVKRIL